MNTVVRYLTEGYVETKARAPRLVRYGRLLVVLFGVGRAGRRKRRA